MITMEVTRLPCVDLLVANSVVDLPGTDTGQVQCEGLLRINLKGQAQGVVKLSTAMEGYEVVLSEAHYGPGPAYAIAVLLSEGVERAHNWLMEVPVMELWQLVQGIHLGQIRAARPVRWNWLRKGRG